MPAKKEPYWGDWGAGKAGFPSAPSPFSSGARHFLALPFWGRRRPGRRVAGRNKRGIKLLLGLVGREGAGHCLEKGNPPRAVRREGALPAVGRWALLLLSAFAPFAALLWFSARGRSSEK